MTSDTLENFLADNAHFAVNTVLNYRKVFAGWREYLDGRAPTARLVEEWTISMMRDGKAISTIHMHRRLLAHVCRWAEENGQGVQLVKRMKSLPRDPREAEHDRCIRREEFTRLMIYPYPESDLWFPQMVRFGWETGLRLSDCVMLKWVQVDLAERTVRVQPTKTKRNSQSIHVPLSDEMIAILKARNEVRRETSLDVWPEAKYEAERNGLTYHSARFRWYARKCGLPKGRCFHGLRHARVTTLLEAGASTAMVRAFTGHSLQVLERYAGHVSIEAKRAAFDKANNMKL